MEPRGQTEGRVADAQTLLGVPEDASAEQLRQAYVEAVRKHPPDRDPDRFERIRDAYELLKDPLLRAKQVLAVSDPSAPLASLVSESSPRRQYASVDLWMNVLRERRK